METPLFPTEVVFSKGNCSDDPSLNCVRNRTILYDKADASRGSPSWRFRASVEQFSFYIFAYGVNGELHVGSRVRDCAGSGLAMYFFHLR